MVKKILLADDSLTIQKVVELTFSDSDYELICVSNGQRALDRVREARPDLILADAVMPEKNGYEVCEAIKGDPATSRIPVVLLSGTFEPFDRERAERIGADAIVSKPFDSQQLLAQVDALLERGPGGRGQGAASSRPAMQMPSTTAAIAIPPLPEPAASASAEEAPFDVGFSAEDFTAAIRLPPARTGIDPFEEEYGRGDVDSAIEAFEREHPGYGPGSSGEPGGKPAESSLALADRPLSSPDPARDPQWLDEETDKAPFASEPEPEHAEAAHEAETGFAELNAAEDEGGAAGAGTAGQTRFAPVAEPEEDESAATVAISRMDFPEPPPAHSPDPPTVEMPIQAFGRTSAATADAGAGTMTWGEAGSAVQEPHEIPDPDASASAAAAPSPSPSLSPTSRSGATEISAQDAAVLFDVSGAGVAPEANAPGPVSDADRPTDPGVAVAASARAAAEAAEPGDSSEPSVPGEIEMLAQRSSIPELTKMLSNVRSTSEAAGMSDEQIERLATRVVEKLSDKIVRQIAWEVIPDMAEIVIKQRIKELESGVE